MTAATWWLQDGRGGTYVRAELPARHLPGKLARFGYDSVVLEGQHPDGSPRVVFPQQEGAAIWCLPGNATRGAMMRGQQLNGTRVLVEVDDNYLVKPPHATQWLKTVAEAGAYDHHSIEAHRRIVENVTDGVIVSTRFLEKQYRKVHDRVYVCQNCVDPDDWEEPEKPDDGLLRIGWAASESHAADAPLLTRAMRWLAEQDGVQIVLIGLHPRQWDDLPALRVPWTDDLAAYRRSLSVLDVGLAPVKPNEWSLARSDLKALEYSMAGAVSVVQENDCFAPWLGGDMPCLTASNPREFFHAVRWCVQHRDELKDIARQARDYVLGCRTIEGNAWRWSEAIEG